MVIYKSLKTEWMYVTQFFKQAQSKSNKSHLLLRNISSRLLFETNIFRFHTKNIYDRSGYYVVWNILTDNEHGGLHGDDGSWVGFQNLALERRENFKQLQSGPRSNAE